jgi:putative membrane protein
MTDPTGSDQGGARGSPAPVGSPGPRTGSPEPAGSPGPRTGSPEPAGSPEPRTGGPEPAASSAPRTGGAGQAGAEPDARFTFANERTFLAWSRTGLALIVAGLGIVQLLPPFPGVPWGRHLIGVPLIVLGAIVAVAGYTEWVRNQRALRRGEPVPRSFLPVILAATIAAIAVISAVVLLLSAVR